MRDLIDERNFREMCNRSIVKGYNVHYMTQEEIEQQQRAVTPAQEFTQKQKSETQAQEEYDGVFTEAEHYGEKETDDPVTKEQIAKILGYREEKLQETIHNSMSEES